MDDINYSIQFFSGKKINHILGMLLHTTLYYYLDSFRQATTKDYLQKNDAPEIQDLCENFLYFFPLPAMNEMKFEVSN